MTNEMIKLRDLLDYHNIPWEDYSDPDFLNYRIDRTKFHIKHNYYSVVHGFGTYGGWNQHQRDYGLLEMQINSEEPMGWMTAEDVIAIVLKK